MFSVIVRHCFFFLGSFYLCYADIGSVNPFAVLLYVLSRMISNDYLVSLRFCSDSIFYFPLFRQRARSTNKDRSVV